jgi:hypothetical protein
MIIFISQNEYMLSQEYKELRQQISKSDRTMSQNIKGIYLLNFFMAPLRDIGFFPCPSIHLPNPHLISTQVPLQ